MSTFQLYPTLEVKPVFRELRNINECYVFSSIKNSRVSSTQSSYHCVAESETVASVMWILLLGAPALFFMYRWFKERQQLTNPQNKYVLITGCDSGFGNLLAKKLDLKGLQVLAACLTEKGASDLKEATSSRLQTLILDVTDSNNVAAAARWADGVVGDQGLWGLVNNAGISVPVAPNEWLTKDDFMKILNVNLLGVVDVTVKMLPLIRKAKGRIVNVASIAGRITLGGGGYFMSKYGVESFSDSLRCEVASFGVKVCIIEPGFFSTEITSAKSQKENLIHIWDRLPEEIKKSYGQEYYDTVYSFLDHIAKICNTDLSLVTDCMEHALMAVYPRKRYSAGWDAKLIYLPLSYFPSVVTDFLLSIGMPKPATGI
uniref:Uncharacterized protein n=1 Tax=Leptobrachium leishanense TaxID=445787 RepID=A0A8C5MCE3_9ANUR